MDFEKTLPAIMLQESSARLGIIGDDKKTVYFYKNKGKEYIINKSETFIEDGKRYYNYQPIKNIYVKKAYTKKVYKHITKSSIGPYQIKLSTARLVIKKFKMHRYYSLLKDNDRLITLLQYDVRFSSIIACNYLKYNYIRAVKRGFKNPWRAAVSHYNGGWNNIKYISKIQNRMKEIKANEV